MLTSKLQKDAILKYYKSEKGNGNDFKTKKEKEEKVHLSVEIDLFIFQVRTLLPPEIR